MLEIAEEQLVCATYTLGNVLGCLRAEAIPESQALCFLEFRDVSAEPERIQAFSKPPIVSAVQGNQVIVDHSGKVDLTV
jgi:hypothetical protein